jgi:hypothetical protein
MLFTNAHQLTKWKDIGNTRVSYVPSLTRYDPSSTSKPNVRRANPMKHFRYQLNQTSHINRPSSHIDGNYMNKPGSTFNLGFSDSGPNKCCASDLSGSDKHVIQTYIEKFPQLTLQNLSGGATKVQNNGKIAMGVEHTGNNELHATIQTGIWETKCIACNPENNVIKRARTLLSKAYYTDTKAYLRSRNQTYDQKLSGGHVKNTVYTTADNKLIYPTNENKTSTFTTLTCVDKCQDSEHGGATMLTYKPSNREFSHQGAVASSTRIDKLKLDTINKNAKSFKPAWGSEGANAAKYNGSGTAPYFLKSKNNNNCNTGMFNKNIYHKDGNKTVCFHTNTGDRQLQSKTTTMIYTRPNKVNWTKS